MDTDPAYIVEVSNPYTGFDQQIPCLTAEAVGRLVEEKTGTEAAVITADLEADGSYETTDGETGLEVSVHPAAAPVPA